MIIAVIIMIIMFSIIIMITIVNIMIMIIKTMVTFYITIKNIPLLSVVLKLFNCVVECSYCCQIEQLQNILILKQTQHCSTCNVVTECVCMHR